MSDNKITLQKEPELYLTRRVRRRVQQRVCNVRLVLVWYHRETKAEMCVYCVLRPPGLFDPKCIQTHTDTWTRAQPLFQSWGSNSLVYMVLLPFYRKKLDRSTQFGAVGYIITLYSSKSYVKVGGPSKFWGGPDPLDPQWLRPCTWTHNLKSERMQLAEHNVGWYLD